MCYPIDLSSIRPLPVSTFKDHRGVLLKVLTSTGLGKDRISFGELYASTTLKGETRGCHFHRLTTEWFFVVQGRMHCRLALPGKEDRSEFMLDADTPQVIEVPPGVAHSLTAVSEEPCLLMAYADRSYDEDRPDQEPFGF
ncbi:MAG: WxcM-like domain-containing protein [Planctomycetes bacterium]|nr:WxcM-like domain-containing protein [Planctomycetota bacterium]